MSKPATVFMFSGQGSQYYHMGRDLFHRDETFRKHMLQVDRLFQDLLGQSIVDAVYDEKRNKADSFDHLRLSHPAIFMVEHALAQTLKEYGVTPDYVLGASMGVFAATTLAGCLPLERAARMVVHQAIAVETHCSPGGMLAVLQNPTLFQAKTYLRGNSELAAVNFSSHFVVAAQQQHLTEIEKSLRAEDVASHKLPVPYAFHSRWIDAATVPYGSVLTEFAYARPVIPIVCCAKAEIVNEIPRDYSWMAVREPVRFCETLAHMESMGDYFYVDVGPSGTLATFAKYNLTPNSRSSVFPLVTPFERDVANLKRAVSVIASG